MSRAQFDEFVRRQTEAAVSTPSFDRDAEIRRWHARLNGLFSRIRELLSDYLSAGTITSSVAVMPLYEEALGPYEAEALIINVGPAAVRFEPVGAFIFGARGRVDMIGQRGRRKLMFVEAAAKRVQVKVSIVEPGETPAASESVDEAAFAWKFVTEPPHREFIDLSQDSLMEAIVEITSG